MFYKVATTQTQITPIIPSSRDYLMKTASKWIDVNDFDDRYKGLFADYNKAQEMRIGQYNPEFKYYRVIALHGDVPNDNGDFWHWGSRENVDAPELLRFDASTKQPVYASFIGRGNYKNHDNDDVTKAVGLILDVAPNHEGKFIEALLAVDTKKDPELVRGIEAGYLSKVSMGCLCGYSICSLCGQKSRTEAEYCDHVKYHKGQTIWYNGKYAQVYEDNRDVNFIELSWVTVPADPDAVLLERVANTISLSENSTLFLNAMRQVIGDTTIALNYDEQAQLKQKIMEELHNYPFK